MNRLGRAMADPTRSRILLTLLDRPSYPAVLSRELNLTRSNVSNHLTCLRGCGLVSTEPVGRRVRYQLADPRLAGALAQLASLVLVVSDGTAPGEPCGPEVFDFADELDDRGSDDSVVPPGVSHG